MRLSAFIRENADIIIRQWEDYARNYVAASAQIDRSALRDNITNLLKYLVEEMEPKAEQASPAAQGSRAEQGHVAAKTHAEHRFLSGFDSLEMISEFFALRERILQMWLDGRKPDDEEIADLRKFGRIVDHLVAESLTRYSESEKRARTLFLGTLIHDLKNPLNAISQSAQLLPALGGLSDKQSRLAAQIFSSAHRMNDLVSQLIDAVRIQLGKGIPLKREPMDVKEVAQKTVAEIQAAYPGNTILIYTEGDTAGELDPGRITQVTSNLVANAVEHGGKAPIKVTVAGEKSEIVLSVHNTGPPIPPGVLPALFDPLVRAETHSANPAKGASLGLGLFIAREIALAHGGSISATSTEENGTTFTARFPRHFAAH